ncbi:MAG: hypothetical protein IKW30_03850 [Lachnospiraceae bacterium]|nr:hypothetical protein [Lachnospiraceae bacterium]
MQEQELDMEVTEYRAITMIETLARLYAHQMGMEIKSLKIYTADKDGNKLPEKLLKEVV